MFEPTKLVTSSTVLRRVGMMRRCLKFPVHRKLQRHNNNPFLHTYLLLQSHDLAQIRSHPVDSKPRMPQAVVHVKGRHKPTAKTIAAYPLV